MGIVGTCAWSGGETRVPDVAAQLATWPTRRWLAGAVAAVATVLLVAIPTDMLANPYFTRSMPVTWWAWPVLAVTAVLSGLLMATYVAVPQIAFPAAQRSTRLGWLGMLATFFAVGCPVCNKLVVLALGISGTMAWFAPIQPLLALASLILLIVALRVRLKGLAACPVALPSTVSRNEAAPSSLGPHSGA